MHWVSVLYMRQPYDLTRTTICIIQTACNWCIYLHVNRDWGPRCNASHLGRSTPRFGTGQGLFPADRFQLQEFCSIQAVACNFVCSSLLVLFLLIANPVGASAHVFFGTFRCPGWGRSSRFPARKGRERLRWRDLLHLGEFHKVPQRSRSNLGFQIRIFSLLMSDDSTWFHVLYFAPMSSLWFIIAGSTWHVFPIRRYFKTF